MTQRKTMTHMVRKNITALLAMLLTAAPSVAGIPQQPAEAAIENLIKTKDAEIGVAWMTGNKLVTAGDDALYPLMSVFKLHVATSVLMKMERQGTPPDTVMNVRAEQMREGTYSPLRKLHPGRDFSITMRELLRWSVAESDNNACDILIEYAGGIGSVSRDMYRAGVRRCHLSETEASMQADPMRSYANWSTPESVVLLLRRIYDGRILTGKYLSCLKDIMASCVTGPDKIKAGLQPGMTLAHKTGTGFRLADGTKTADNDAGVITLPDGRQIFIAVLIKDSRESDAENAKTIAEITRMITEHSLNPSPMEESMSGHEGSKAH